MDVLYGSEALYLKVKDLQMARLLSWPRANQFKKIRNQSELPEYIGIRRGSGKVLCLELSLYNNMMVQSGNVLALNYETDQKYKLPLTKQPRLRSGCKEHGAAKTKTAQ